MTTPVYLTGFEYGSTPTANGGGLSESVSGSPTLVTSPVHSGNYALKLACDGVAAQYMRMPISGTPQIGVVRFYLRLNAVASGQWAVFIFNFLTYGSSAQMEISTAGAFKVTVGAGATITGQTLTLDKWYLIDMRLNITAATWTLDWSVDGVAQTQATMASQPTTDSITYSRFGSSSTSINTGICYFDDYVYSETSGDYPIGHGGTQLLKPTSDGTHNAGTNVIEDDAGTDIGVTTAWDKIDAIPMSISTTYIRQAPIGTGNYAEVLFEDITAPHNAIIGALGILAYTSATTSANTGATIMSKDSFSTNTSIWGTTSTPADMSDGSLSNLYYKTAIIAGATTDALVNDLKARIGYSSDATPDPYWINLAVEVAYEEAVGHPVMRRMGGIPYVMDGNPIKAGRTWFKELRQSIKDLSFALRNKVGSYG